MSFKLQVSLLAVITVVALMWTSGVADMHEQAALDAGAIVDSPAPTYRPPAPRPAQRITAPTSTSTTTTTPDRGVCGEWYDLALMAGWPAADWPFLQHLIYGESRCLHDVYNPNGADNSWGLLQINTHAASGNRQFIAELLGTDDYTLLTDPAINLWVGRQMWVHAAKSGCPWRLWSTRGDGWCA